MTRRLPRLLAVGVACAAAAVAGGTALAVEPVEEAAARFVERVTPEELGKIVAKTEGKPSVINFWATWCPPCIKEMPEFVRFVEEYPEKDVRFLSVSVDHPDTIERRVRPFVEEEELPFPVWVYAGMPDEAGEHLPFELHGAVPVTVVLDAEGEVVRLWDEEITFEQIEAVVLPLLKKGSDS